MHQLAKIRLQYMLGPKKTQYKSIQIRTQNRVCFLRGSMHMHCNNCTFSFPFFTSNHCFLLPHSHQKGKHWDFFSCENCYFFLENLPKFSKSQNWKKPFPLIFLFRFTIMKHVVDFFCFCFSSFMYCFVFNNQILYKLVYFDWKHS